MSSSSRMRERAAANKRDREFSAIQNKSNALPSQQESDELEQRVDQHSGIEKNRQDLAREGYKKDAMADVTTPMQGLDPKAKLAMQETANNQINSQLGNYSRMLSGQAGARGMRGGAANALQTELQQQGLEASNQFNRDISEKDADLQMQRLAAYITAIEGRNSQDVLNRQQSRDYLTGEREKKKQSALEAYYSKYFNSGV